MVKRICQFLFSAFSLTLLLFITYSFLLTSPAYAGNSVYIDPNPVNTGSHLTLTGTGSVSCSTWVADKSGGGYGSCSIIGGFICGPGNPKDGNPCWWQWDCTAGAEGNYTAYFSSYTDASLTTENPGCGASVNYTVRACKYDVALGSYTEYLCGSCPPGYKFSRDHYYWSDGSGRCAIIDSGCSYPDPVCGLPPATADIKANGSDGPITIAYNTSATLSWTSTNALSCSVSPGGWTDLNKPAQSTGNLITSTTYTLTCTGSTTATDSVTIFVSPPPSPPPSPTPPPSPPPSPPPFCGNGIIEAPETCDDGLAANGPCPATCSTSCTTNICILSPSPSPPPVCPALTCSYSEPAPGGGLQIVTGYSPSGCSGFNVCSPCDYIYGCSTISPYVEPSSDACKEIHDPAEIGDIPCIIQNIIRLLAPAAAIAFFIMLLIGGFRFLTSGGDPKATAQAKTILTMALIGIILVVVSWLILTLIRAITSVDVTKVGIPGIP